MDSPSFMIQRPRKPAATAPIAISSDGRAAGATGAADALLQNFLGEFGRVGAAPLRGRHGFRRDGGSTDRAGPVLREPPLQARAVEDVRAGQPLVAAPDRLLADDALNFLTVSRRVPRVKPLL